LTLSALAREISWLGASRMTLAQPEASAQKAAAAANAPRFFILVSPL
jgi:hypothetical protein